jgi:hypothetical protein
VITSAVYYAFFVKKYCNNPTELLAGDRQACVSVCTLSTTTDFINPYCGSNTSMSQTDGVATCPITCNTCAESLTAAPTLVCLYCFPLNQRYWDPAGGGSCFCYPGYYDTN